MYGIILVVIFLSKLKKRLLIILLVFLLYLIILITASCIIYERSAMASILEMSMNQVDLKNRNKTREFFEEELVKLKNDDYEITSNYDIPKEISYVDNMKVYKYDVSGDNVIIYIHGGAYVSQLNEFQVSTAMKLAKKTNSKIYIPLYPLAPKHTFEESYELLDKLYSKIISENEYSKIIIAGDSAGGGLALGFGEYLLTKEIRRPDYYILISPWIDISMENEDIKDYEEVDPMLNKIALIVDGDAWRGNVSNKDYRVSPLFGNMEGLSNVFITIGTREILYPDALLLYDKLVTSGVNAKLEIGKNMNHTYVGYPIVEADEAIEKIVEFINSEGGIIYENTKE